MPKEIFSQSEEDPIFTNEVKEALNIFAQKDGRAIPYPELISKPEEDAEKEVFYVRPAMPINTEETSKPFDREENSVPYNYKEGYIDLGGGGRMKSKNP